MKKMIAAAALTLAAGSASAAEYSTDRADFEPFIGPSWLFFFEEGGQEYFKTISCSDVFGYDSSGALEVRCHSGINENWFGLLSMGGSNILMLYQKNSVGGLANDTYVYAIGKISTANFFTGGITKYVVDENHPAKSTYLRRLVIDPSLPDPNQDVRSRSADELVVGSDYPSFNGFTGILTMPRVDVDLGNGSAPYSIRMKHFLGEFGDQFRITSAEEK